MTELTPFRFGIDPPPRPKPPKSRPQSMEQPGIRQSGIATTPGASITMSGNTPTGAIIRNSGATSGAPMHQMAVSAPSQNPSPAANGVVPGAMAGPVQSFGVLGTNGYAANTMPGVYGIPASGPPTAPTAPTLAQAAASALATTANTAPYTPTAPPPPNITLPTSTPPKSISTAPIRSGRGNALSEEDKVILLKICVECQNTLKFSTKTAFYRRVSDRFEAVRGRPYSAGSCERIIVRLTDARRLSLKNAGGKRVLSDAQKMSLLVDQMIDVQDDVEQKAKQKEAEIKEMMARLEPGYNGTSALQTPARKTGNQQDKSQASPSIFDQNTPRGSQSSNATSPEIDITDNDITITTTEERNDDDPMGFESTVITELSRIRRLVTHEATVSVATTNFLKKNHQSLKSQLDRLEDKFKEMQNSLDQQTGIMSDQNTVLKQILTMMSHGRRSPMTPGPPYQGPPFQGPPPSNGAPYYPPHPGPPYYPYYQGPPVQGPQPQEFPPQGPVPQGPLPQGPQAQSQPQKTQPQPPQTQGAQPQGTQPQSSKPQGTRPPKSQPPTQPPAQPQDSQTPGPKPEASQPQAPPSQQGTQPQPQTQLQAQPQAHPSQETQPQGPPAPQGKFAVFSGWVS